MGYITSDMFFGTMGVLFRYKVQTDMGGDGVCALIKDTHFQNGETRVIEKRFSYQWTEVISTPTEFGF